MEEKPMKVYCIENKLDGKKYIGITKGTIERRFKRHIEIAKYKEKKQHLHKAMIKYGIENFTVYELDFANSKEELFQKEKNWIKKLDTKNNGYNETDGGEGTWGWKPSPEKQKILNEKQKELWKENLKLREEHSKKAKERWNSLSDSEKEKRKLDFLEVRKLTSGSKGKTWKLSEETKLKISQSKMGHFVSEEVREKMRERKIGTNNPRYGKKHSPETIEKMRQSALNRMRKVGT